MGVFSPSFFPSPPVSNRGVLLLVEVIILLARSLYCLFLQFILLRDICKAPEQVVYADRLLRSIVFWHGMSHFSTCQSLLVLYSVTSVLSIVKVRHRNLVPLIALHPPGNIF